jgi:hypothetical protein
VPEQKPSKKPIRGQDKELYDELIGQLDQKIKNLRPEESQKWFRERIRSALGDRSRRISRSIPQVGELVTFLYDPKYKDVLPYYDQFPLTFIMDVNPTGFLGISMHYLRTRDRLALYKRFLRLATDPNLSETTRLNLSYAIIKDNRDYLLAKTCIKRYLFTQMLTVPTVVPAPQWELTLGLPVAMFAKSTSASVYAAEARKRS